MGANTFGTYFQVTTFGESHGSAMGAIVDGCPAGVPFSWELLNEKMVRRRPGFFPWMSSRKEPDKPELLSGVFEGYTIGTPIALLVKNMDHKSEEYHSIKNKPRPGHADDLWTKKFGRRDYRGGGRSSGRETIGRVLGGSIAEMFLKQIYPHLKVKAVPVQIGPFIREKINVINDNIDASIDKTQNNWFGVQTKAVEEFLVQKKNEGLSYGGTIELRINHPPPGLGQPVFRKLKSDLASAFMGIGSCYEVSLGDKQSNLGDKKSNLVDKTKKEKEGGLSQEEGSKLHGLKSASIYGGIRGGISTGEPIIFQMKFKPPASVLDVAKKGRHDPCVVPRALVVVEAMAQLVIADHVLWSRQDKLS